MADNAKTSSNIGHLLGRPPERRTFAEAAGLVLNRCFIGVEFEFEGVEGFPDSLREYWNPHNDGSLRDGGVEFSMNGPMCGQDAVDAIAELLDCAKKSKWITSERCGLHVHLDVRNLSQDQLAALAVAYAITEPLLFRFAGEHRANNQFCCPWIRAAGELDAIGKVLRADSGDELRRLGDTVHKYAALNFGAMYKYGTIEFRHLQCTTDNARVLQWVNMILSLKRYVMHERETPKDVLMSVSADPKAFVFNVYKDLAGTLLYPGAEQDMEEALDMAHLLVVKDSGLNRKKGAV